MDLFAQAQLAHDIEKVIGCGPGRLFVIPDEPTFTFVGEPAPIFDRLYSERFPPPWSVAEPTACARVCGDLGCTSPLGHEGMHTARDRVDGTLQHWR